MKIPVLLVNEAQMDSIVPYHLTRGLNKQGVQNRLREALGQTPEEREPLERAHEEASLLQRAWDEIQRGIEYAAPEDEPNSVAYWVRFTPVGLYFGRYNRMPNLESLTQQASGQIIANPLPANGAIKPPVIFICPERVVGWANRLSVDPNLVFDKVLYHELGHAYMDTSSSASDSVYQTPWGRVIEESLANHIAFSCFRGIEARYVQKLISTQPAEYQGYLSVNLLYRLFSGDTDMEMYPELMREFHEWLGRHYGFRPFYEWVIWIRHNYPFLLSEWVERASPNQDTRRLRHWRRFKQAWSSHRNTRVEEKEF